MLGGLVRNSGESKLGAARLSSITGTSRLGGMSRMESDASSLGKFDAGSDSIAIKNYQRIYDKKIR